jgi:hypothetical protein
MVTRTTLYREDRGRGFAVGKTGPDESEVDALRTEIRVVTERITALERRQRSICRGMLRCSMIVIRDV